MPVDLIAVVSHQIILSFSASAEVMSKHVVVDSEKRLSTFSLILRSKHGNVHIARVLKLSMWLLNKNKYNTEVALGGSILVLLLPVAPVCNYHWRHPVGMPQLQPQRINNP